VTCVFEHRFVGLAKRKLAAVVNGPGAVPESNSYRSDSVRVLATCCRSRSGPRRSRHIPAYSPSPSPSRSVSQFIASSFFPGPLRPNGVWPQETGSGRGQTGVAEAERRSSSGDRQLPRLNGIWLKPNRSYRGRTVFGLRRPAAAEAKRELAWAKRELPKPNGVWPQKIGSGRGQAGIGLGQTGVAEAERRLASGDRQLPRPSVLWLRFSNCTFWIHETLCGLQVSRELRQFRQLICGSCCRR
jgi:hypothetical protein